jgi:hypothetical protein
LPAAFDPPLPPLAEEPPLPLEPDGDSSSLEQATIPAMAIAVIPSTRID